MRVRKMVRKKVNVRQKKDAALSLAEDGMSVEKIARLIKVSEVEVRKWLDESVCFTK